jgi:peptidyl-tRNA hydrolase, PTH1 family
MAGDRSLIVGLGNPEARYAGTRHNVGFVVLDVLAARAGGRFTSARGRRAAVLETRIDTQPVVLAKPASYMNESGASVASLCRFYKTPVESLVVVHDELDLPFGSLRLKRGGGDSGHNGMRSVTAAVGTREYARVRFGIGRPPGRQDPADFVLRGFTAAERKELPYLLDRAADAVTALVLDGLESAQNAFND